METKADIGLIGLAVMGENLAISIESKVFKVALYNRTLEKIDRFLSGRGKKKNITGTRSIEELAASLKRPRKVILMIKAGDPVDNLINLLAEKFDKEDIIIDGGNAHYLDTRRRAESLEKKGILYIGAGISGGEEGALKGPSIMPGGSESAWPAVKKIMQSIAATADDGAPCCEWIGSEGAGHFVKMVHNAIEYGEMQLISEAYNILKNALGMDALEMHNVFSRWNGGRLNGYLLEITCDIMTAEDSQTGRPLVEMIRDEAQQKGTGSWAIEAALEIGTPAPVLAEAVFSRYISVLKTERLRAAQTLTGPDPLRRNRRKELVDALENALYASRICTYAQGFALLQKASAENGWKLDCRQIAMIWREGCIIRAAILHDISEAFCAAPDLSNLMISPVFADNLNRIQGDWRHTIKCGIESGLPVVALSSALAYYDSYRSASLPANLLQAQRDYFGAHRYKRTDREGSFHTDWPALCRKNK